MLHLIPEPQHCCHLLQSYQNLSITSSCDYLVCPGLKPRLKLWMTLDRSSRLLRCVQLSSKPMLLLQMMSWSVCELSSQPWMQDQHHHPTSACRYIVFARTFIGLALPCTYLLGEINRSLFGCVGGPSEKQSTISGRFRFSELPPTHFGLKLLHFNRLRQHQFCLHPHFPYFSFRLHCAHNNL